ncbi:hypothetical protein [Acetobacter conturbans]|uniref:Uncharacterized protein n=1 Tax=Acetobacter conturbans TaxID=1737472 RepID=A0ABX0JW56_9PROT|nr:hypothetical protein [Acetobacter conturbans]NHN87728.1 hypothetical protein [Acetobacter conturbans]
MSQTSPEDNYTLESGIGRLQDEDGPHTSRWASVNDCMTDGLDILRDLTVDTPIRTLSVALVFGSLCGMWLARR